jgi:hypothetical protein
MTTQRYIQEILQPVTIPFAYGHEGTLFQQDNSRPHIARISMKCLEEASVDVPPWLPRSERSIAHRTCVGHDKEKIFKFSSSPTH